MSTALEESFGDPATWADRFWSKVDRRSGQECWEWQAARRADGYGQFSLGGARGHMYQAHRVSWTLANGTIPEGLLVRHRCDNRPCVNPAHLELGTHLDNMHDMATRERHGVSRLTADGVRSIRRRNAAGESYSTLASEYGVSTSAIAFAVRRETWRHVA